MRRKAAHDSLREANHHGGFAAMTSEQSSDAGRARTSSSQCEDDALGFDLSKAKLCFCCG
jgi:hypothetical protein